MSHSQKTGRTNETILERQQGPTRIQERFKSNNSNNQKGGNQKGNAGDLHALTEKAERIKESLEKALKQQETNCKKRKREENHVTFSEDDAVVEEETQQNRDDNYLFELDQLSLNDADL